MPRMREPYRTGHIQYGTRLIRVTTETRQGRQRTPQAISQILWHEMTHAILEDMGHRLVSNELFVEAFSQRLSKAIDSAEF